MARVTRVYQFDGQGSTRALVDSTGAVTDTFTFDAWGNQVSRTGTTKTPFQWNGRWGYYRDEETDTYQVRRRSFRPLKGRWPAADPLRFIQGVNLYLYSDNNPTTNLDPSGLAKCCVKSFDVSKVRKSASPLAEDQTKLAIRGRFEVTASFIEDAAKDCCCYCCEYRQYVKGSFRHKGEVFPKMLPDGPLLEDVFNEDGVFLIQKGGGSLIARPGHRIPLPGEMRADDEYSDVPPNRTGESDRKYGCGYSFRDLPGLDGVPRGDSVVINLTFHGFIYDKCNKKSVSGVGKTWPLLITGFADEGMFE